MTGALTIDNAADGAATVITEVKLQRDSDAGTVFEFANAGTGDMTLLVDTNEVWHAGNDGPGTGLDADTLDTYQAADFSLAGHTHDHSALNNLAVGDDHTQYALLAGRGSGQALTGAANTDGTLTLRSASDNTGTVAINPAGGNTAIGTAAANNKLTVGGNADVTGNLGVGTAAPGQRLVVQGADNTAESVNLLAGAGTGTMTVYVDGALGMLSQSTFSGFEGALYYDTEDKTLKLHNGTQYYDLLTSLAGGAIDGSGSIGKLARFSASNTIADSIVTDDGTNVGIGQGTPATKLHVGGGVSFDELATAPGTPPNTRGVLYYDQTAKKFKVSENGGSFINLSDLTAGSGVTSVTTGDGLTGGEITTTGQIDLLLNASGGLSKTLNVNELGIAASGVATGMIADLAVTNGKLAADAVTTGKIADGTIASADLGALGATLAGEVLEWDGAQWTAGVDDNTTYTSSSSINVVQDGAISAIFGTSGGTVAEGSHNHDAVYSQLAHLHESNYVNADSVLGDTMIGPLTINNAGGADALYSETGVSRSVDGSETTFDISNPGTGTMKLTVDGYEVWHTNNDGTDSGLHADLLDGYHAGDFSLATHNHDADYVDDDAGEIDKAADFSFSGPTKIANLDADLLDGHDSAWYMPATTDNWIDDDGDTITGQLISTVATGTAPFSVASTTLVTNLNADRLDGQHASAFSLTSHGHDHSALTGLTGTDHHTQYALLNGRGASQVLNGSNTAGGQLYLRGTSNVTKGDVIIADDGGLVGIGTDLPSSKLTVAGDADTTGSLGIGTAALAAATRLKVKGADDTHAKALFVAGTDNGANGDTSMRVGINTTVPVHDLTVNGIAAATDAILIGSVPINATLHVERDSEPAHVLVKTTTSGQASLSFDRARVDDVAGIGIDTAGVAEWRLGTEAGTSDFTISEDMTPRLTIEKATDTVVIPSLRVTDGNQDTGKVLTSDASGNASWQDTGTTGWLRTGNDAPFTDNVDNLLGTKAGSAAPLNILANGERALRLEPDTATVGVSPNIIGGASNNAVGGGVVGAAIAGGGAVSDGAVPQPNTVTASYGAIGGGYGNEAASFAVVGGGQQNTASGTHSTVGGGAANTALAPSATVGGGEFNLAQGSYSTVGGGARSTTNTLNNIAYDNYATIGGGGGNRAGNADAPTTTAPYATIGGGEENTATSAHSTVGGGRFNDATGNYAAVGGGYNNTASALEATVAGGASNVASGGYSAIPGGLSNAATGDWSFAAGRQAKANHQGAFVWADSTAANFTSTGQNQFLIRASGGVGVGTDSPGAQLHVVGDDSFGNAGFASVFTTTLPDDVTMDTGVAVAGTISTGGAGDEDYVAAASFRAQTTPVAGTVGSIVGIFTDVTHQSGSSVDEAIGLHVGSLTNAGTVNSTYGIKIENLTAGTQPADSVYAIHSQDPNATTHLAGDVGIGTDPTVGRLHVESESASLEPALNAHVDAQTIDDGGDDVVPAVRGLATTTDMGWADEDVVAGGHFSAVHVGATDANAIAGVVADVGNEGGVLIKKAVGVRVQDIANAGTLQQTMGVSIGNLTAGSQSTLPWSIHSEDPNARLYNAGRVGIGEPEPAAMLDVAGAALVSGGLAVGGSDLFVNVATNRVGINDATPSYALDVTGTIRATGQLHADILTGTAPLVVRSTTKVTNLNADLLDGCTTGPNSGNIPISNTDLNTDLNADMLDDMHAADFATAGHGHDHGTLAGLGDDDHPQYFHLSQNEAVSGTPSFTAATPFNVSSSTWIQNLNADYLDNLSSSSYFILNQDETVTGRPSFDGGDVTYPPFYVDSDIVVSNLNADLLDGKSSADFMSAGTDNWVNVTGDTMSGPLTINNNLAVDSTTLYVNAVSNSVGIGTATPGYPLHVNGDVKIGEYLYLGSAENLYDGGANLLKTDDSFEAVGAITSGGNVVAGSQLVSNTADGTAPVSVTSTTLCTNLNVDRVDNYHAGNSSGQVAVSNGTLCTTLNADRLDGLDQSSFARALHNHAGENITSGTVADARIASTLTRDSEVFGIVLANDGSGSGLHADYLDGYHGTSYLRSDTSDSFTSGTLTMGSTTTLSVTGDFTMSGTNPFLVVDGTGYAGLTLDRGTSTSNGYILYKTAGANTFSAGLVGDNNYSICEGFNNEKFTITPAGNVAVNDSTPMTTAQFSVTSTVESYAGYFLNSYGSSAYGVYGYANGSGTNRGTYGRALNGTTNYGVYGYGSTYDFYAAGTGTNYGPFTGGHEVKFSADFPAEVTRGMLVCVTGETQIRIDEESKVEISSTMPTVRLACTADDPAVFGVVVAETPLGDEHWYEVKEGERFGTVNALGEGRLWVSDINGRVKPGDYVTSSSIPGYAQRQDDDVLHSYTVGKVTEEVDWDSSEVETVEHEGKTYKVYLIAVVYTSG